MATEKIFVQIGEDKIELTGQAKADFISDREHQGFDRTTYYLVTYH